MRAPEAPINVRPSDTPKSGAMSDKGVTCNICDLCQKRDKCQKKILPAARQWWYYIQIDRRLGQTEWNYFIIFLPGWEYDIVRAPFCTVLQQCTVCIDRCTWYLFASHNQRKQIAFPNLYVSNFPDLKMQVWRDDYIHVDTVETWMPQSGVWNDRRCQVSFTLLLASVLASACDYKSTW